MWLDCAMVAGAHKRKWWLSPSLHVLLFALGLSAYKLLALELGSRELLQCQWCLANKALAYEGQYLFLIAGLHLLAGFAPWRALRFSLRMAVVLVLVITMVDLVVLINFYRRFSLVELLVFGTQFSAISSFAQQLMANIPAALMVTAELGLAAVVLGRYARADRRTRRCAPAVALVALGMTACTMAEPAEFHTGYLKNSVEAFFSRWTSNRPYSAAFTAGLPPAGASKNFCVDGLGQHPNVVLVVFESLSMYHSALYSGMEDWMPQFDAASQGGRRFGNFYANGITSEQGLISLLTGEPPIAKGTGRVSTEFEQFARPPHSLASLLRADGYKTEFLTTGDLGFLGKGTWLKRMGFETIEGSEASAYNGMKRYQFGAAPDDALYVRALQELGAAQGRPVFMTLETVTTHGPFVDPDTGQHSEQRTFRYADKRLGEFIQALRARGFFRNGYLMVMGDHRAMLPLRAGEKARYGDSAYARTPFTIIGPGEAGQLEPQAFSQSDLYPSLRHLTGTGRQCYGPDEGVFLPTAMHAPACIYSHRPYNFNNLYVHCGIKDHEVRLDGDDTAYAGLGGGPQGLLQEVHRLRLGMGFD
jgi:hypothetical protein